MRFKDLADRKSEIFDEDIHALFKDGTEVGQRQDTYQFVSLKQSTETGEQPHATVVWIENGVEKRSTGTGNGPVDAVFSAIEAEVEVWSRVATIQCQCNLRRDAEPGGCHGPITAGGACC